MPPAPVRRPAPAPRRPALRSGRARACPGSGGTLPSRAKPAEELPKKLGVGKEGFFQPAALLLFWFWNQNPGGRDNSLSFRVRRAELRIKGEIVPELVGYMIMIDPRVRSSSRTRRLDVEGQGAGARRHRAASRRPSRDGPTTILQDFNISFLSQYADVTVVSSRSR